MTLGLGFRRHARWWLTGIASLIAATALAGWYAWADDAPKPAAAPATARVQRGTVTATVSASGTIQPAANRGLGFAVSGTVTEVGVKPGDEVTVGQMLAKIDDSDARDAVDNAQSQLDDAQAALTQARDAPAQGGPAGTGGAPTGQHPGCTGSVAGAAFTGAGFAGAAVVEVGSWGHSASPSPSHSASPSPSPSASPSTSPRPSPTSTRPPAGPGPTCTPQNGGGGATGGGATGGGGANGGGSRGSGSVTGDAIFTAEQRVNSAALALQQAQRQLAGTVITAPIAGRVLSVAGTVGSQVGPSGTGFVVLADVSGLQARVQISEADVNGVAVGQPATVTLPAREGQQAYSGKVSQVAELGTVSNRLVTYEVLIAFDDPPADLLIGQTARTAVTVRDVSNVLYVPVGAVRPRAGGGSEVTVVTGDVRSTRPVEVGLRGDQSVEVTSGLAEGDTVLAVGR